MRDFYPCRFHQLRVKSHLFSGVVKRVHKAGEEREGSRARSSSTMNNQHREIGVCQVMSRGPVSVQSVFGTHNTCTVRFEVLTVVLLKAKVLQDVMPRRLVNRCRRPKDLVFIFRVKYPKKRLLQPFCCFFNILNVTNFLRSLDRIGQSSASAAHICC